ncbi:MAG: gamma-glutamylcysteine synthetase [Desulfuromonas sp.]|nr:MAG: gamma-glutamylcysteine synthetase [Desulfuromonas sp.]
MTTLIKPNLDHPVSSRDELKQYLLNGARVDELRFIGTESEKLVIDLDTGEAASYAKIVRVLESLAAHGEWEPITEDGNLLGLNGKHSSITLEPGGQLELSGRLCRDVHCCAKEFLQHVREVAGAGREHRIAFLGLGVLPHTALNQIETLPKKRYDIMTAYMPKVGDMGLRMMKQSAGLQLNLDFTSETDCMTKLRLAQLLAPVLYALFANSPLLEGKPSGFLTTRGEIWARTDPDRTGLIESLHRRDATLDDYVDYALQVPMYFIVRAGELLPLTDNRFTFGDFLESGHAGHHATLTDWDLHLSTIFTEVRLRPQIEIRSIDALPPEFSLAPGALVKGLFYDAEATVSALALFDHLDFTSLQKLTRDSWTLGLKACTQQATLQEYALELLYISRAGLRRQRIRPDAEDEQIFLDAMQPIAESGITLAESLLRKWPDQGRQAQLTRLIEHCGYS